MVHGTREEEVPVVTISWNKGLLKGSPYSKISPFTYKNAFVLRDRRKLTFVGLNSGLEVTNETALIEGKYLVIFLDAIQCSDAGLQAAMASIRTD